MKKLKFICSMLPLFFLCGCFDGHDVKDVAIVMGIGVTGGEDTFYETVTQTVVPKGLSKDGGGDTFENFLGKGAHFGECMENTALKCGKFMHLSHATSLLIDEDIAKSGVYEILDYFMRDNQLRSNLTVAVAQGGIKDIMETESGLLQVPLSSVASLERRFRETSLGDAPRVFDFVSDMMKKDYATMVPIVSIEDGAVTVSGSAVFINGRMIGKLSNTEARGVLWICNKVENGTMTIQFGETSLDVKIIDAKTKIKPIYNEGITFNAEIKCQFGLLRDNYDIVNAYGYEKLKQRINDTVKSEITASFKRLQDMGADVYGLADMLYRKMPEVTDDFKNIKINVKVYCEIKESGGILQSADRR